MDVEKAKAIFEVELEEGKKVARQMKEEKIETAPSNLDTIIEKIEKLGELQAKGYLTEEEFIAQ